MRSVAIASNMLNEADNYLEEWIDNMSRLTDLGIIVVDGGSTDGTKEILEKHGVIVVVDNIIQREGYGPARMHLRRLVAKHFPTAHWSCHFDTDERIDPSDFHRFRWLKDYLSEEGFDVIAFPRLDWYDRERTKSANVLRIRPDFQARMSRLNSPVNYLRRLHEQCIPAKNIYANIDNCPPIQHFHRSASPEKRDHVGKVCSYLHLKDEYGDTYPMHHKEAAYREQLLKEGLNKEGTIREDLDIGKKEEFYG